MKRKLSVILLVILALTGCQKKEQPEPSEETKETVVEKQPTYSTVLLEANASIRLYYDEEKTIGAYDYLGENAEEVWKDVELIGRNVTDGVSSLLKTAEDKGYLNQDNHTVNITVENEDKDLNDKLNDLVNDYIEQTEQELTIALNGKEDDKVVSVAVVQKEEAMPLGIWVSDNWVNPTNFAAANFVRTLILLPDHTGFKVVYVSTIHEQHVPFLTFSWDESGNLNAVDGWEYCGGADTLGAGPNTTYTYEDGVLTEHLSSSEYVTYHHTDSFDPPFWQTYASWTSPDEWYEPKYADLQADFDGITWCINKWD